MLYDASLAGYLAGTARQLWWRQGCVAADGSTGTTSSNMPASGSDSPILVHADAYMGLERLHPLLALLRTGTYW